MLTNKLRRTLILGALVTTNVALAGALFLRSGENAAYAQAGAHDVDLQIVSGRFGQGPAVMYMLDNSSGQLVAVRPGGQQAQMLGHVPNVFTLMQRGK